MKVLITGGTGFVGSNLTAYLTEQNVEVELLDLRKDKLVPQSDNIDALIHIAGKAHDHAGKDTEKEFYDVNVGLTQKAFQLCKQYNIKTFIAFSSIAAVEEFEATQPLTEDAIPHPVSFYGKSKRHAESYLMEEINKNQDKHIVILRPTMIYGKGDKGNLRLLYDLLKKNIPYPLKKFNNRRNFLSIQNLSWCVHQILIKPIPSGIYHVCDDEAVSTNQLVETIQLSLFDKVKMMAVPKPLIYFIAFIGDYCPLPLNSKKLKKLTQSFLVSNQKLKNALGVDKLPQDAYTSIEHNIKYYK